MAIQPGQEGTSFDVNRRTSLRCSSDWTVARLSLPPPLLELIPPCVSFACSCFCMMAVQYDLTGAAIPWNGLEQLSSCTLLYADETAPSCSFHKHAGDPVGPSLHDMMRTRARRVMSNLQTNAATRDIHSLDGIPVSQQPSAEDPKGF